MNSKFKIFSPTLYKRQNKFQVENIFCSQARTNFIPTLKTVHEIEKLPFLLTFTGPLRIRFPFLLSLNSIKSSYKFSAL